MDLEKLPIFEGTEPRITIMNLSGKSGRRTRPFHLGDRVVLVVEGTISRVAHEDTKGGIARAHTLVVEEVYELGADRSVSLIEDLTEEYTRALDDIEGRVQLPFGDDGEEIPDEYEGGDATPADGDYSAEAEPDGDPDAFAGEHTSDED